MAELLEPLGQPVIVRHYAQHKYGACLTARRDSIALKINATIGTLAHARETVGGIIGPS